MDDKLLYMILAGVSTFWSTVHILGWWKIIMSRFIVEVLTWACLSFSVWLLLYSLWKNLQAAIATTMYTSIVWPKSAKKFFYEKWGNWYKWENFSKKTTN